ncbi:Beta-barrel assembly machine subunit BamC [Colwellia chukchiensis]|uniref:Beta-barrel assembly machine subunit BamC n=1 Tax=Colwellia chukchiensis TaxID=641665 RepID=A0A1H7M258_9GAMM|nr:outer membrane protein assembly factor BamC [Colwellia chukchiensis]SEL05350.1 Beta-barrel assembly machine subunit BamC [Colwellia chukchiensis]
MNRKILYFSLLSVAITGCSAVNNKRAVGDFDYAQQQQAPALKIPAGLQKPKTSDTYFVSDQINHQGPIGADVDVRAPSLVLPIAASTRAENNSAAARVWFDQVLDNEDLKTFISQAMKSQLASDNVELRQVDSEGFVYESDWYHHDAEIGTWPFKDMVRIESMRFRFTLESKAHGRSVALAVELIDYQKGQQAGTSKDIDIIDQQRAEMNMLNEVIAQVDYQYRLKQQENRLMRANQLFVNLGENSAGEAAYIVEIDADLLWANLPLFFEDHGFTISDLNESTKIYYVDYQRPEASFWQSIWGENPPVIDLSNGKYQFQVTANEGRSIVTLYDEQGVALSADTLQKIFEVMEAGLSFKEAF